MADLAQLCKKTRPIPKQSLAGAGLTQNGFIERFTLHQVFAELTYSTKLPKKNRVLQPPAAEPKFGKCTW